MDKQNVTNLLHASFYSISFYTCFKLDIGITVQEDGGLYEGRNMWPKFSKINVKDLLSCSCYFHVKMHKGIT